MDRVQPLANYAPFTAQQWIRIRSFLKTLGLPKGMFQTIFKHLKHVFNHGIDTSKESELTDRMGEFVGMFDDNTKIEITHQTFVEPYGDERDVTNGDRVLEQIFTYVCGLTGV